MRLIGAAFVVFVLAIAVAVSGIAPTLRAEHIIAAARSAGAARHQDGQAIFRFDTFGDEQLWTNVLRMHEVIPTIDPVSALSVGLKVDVDALPGEVVSALRAGELDLTNPAVTLELLRLNAVVGIGRRLDGWANTDLNVGAIVALSPSLDDATKAEFRLWGPGKYDPRHHAFDGTNIVPLNTPSLPVVIPPIYGLQNVGFETFTGDGPISYWNGYVGVGQMGGQGNFSDPRIGVFIRQSPDLVTPKLRALLEYQLSLRPPRPPKGNLDEAAVRRGSRLFRDEARCATCHQGPTFTDVLRGPDRTAPVLHEPSETGMDPAYAVRSETSSST